MTAVLTPRKLVRLLKRTPEKRLRIFDLAPGLVDDRGQVDIERAMTMQGELNVAIAEVQTYIRETKELASALHYCNYGKTDWFDEYNPEEDPARDDPADWEDE